MPVLQSCTKCKKLCSIHRTGQCVKCRQRSCISCGKMFDPMTRVTDLDFCSKHIPQERLFQRTPEDLNKRYNLQ